MSVNGIHEQMLSQGMCFLRIHTNTELYCVFGWENCCRLSVTPYRISASADSEGAKALFTVINRRYQEKVQIFFLPFLFLLTQRDMARPHSNVG